MEILPISVDSTASLREFKNKLKMKTELLSDFKRDISSAYGVLNEDRFYSNRAYFLIDKGGYGGPTSRPTMASVGRTQRFWRRSNC